MADEQDQADTLDQDELGLAGDATTSDEVPDPSEVQPPEEAAMHIVDESLDGFDSEVDDPALAAAYELDPEVGPADR